MTVLVIIAIAAALVAIGWGIEVIANLLTGASDGI